jgi:hypothetical protein
MDYLLTTLFEFVDLNIELISTEELARVIQLMENQVKQNDVGDLMEFERLNL